MPRRFSSCLARPRWTSATNRSHGFDAIGDEFVDSLEELGAIEGNPKPGPGRKLFFLLRQKRSGHRNGGRERHTEIDRERADQRNLLDGRQRQPPRSPSAGSFNTRDGETRDEVVDPSRVCRCHMLSYINVIDSRQIFLCFEDN